MFLRMASTVAMLLSLSSCAAYISGELKDIRRMELQNIEFCKPFDHGKINRIDFEIDAGNATGSNMSETISSISLGLIPTYWTSSVKVKPD
ncbi:MAG: hypothetical protein ACT4P0_04470 [Panacagrimonas sp.]